MDALNGKNAEIVFGCEDPIVVPAEGTIGDAWQEHAATLGADPSRPVTFRTGGKLVSSSSLLVAGNTYEATVTHGSKGAYGKGRSRGASKRRDERRRVAKLDAIGVKLIRAA